MTTSTANGRWRNIDEAMRLIKFHPDILLGSHKMAEDKGLAIVQGIKDRTAHCVSDGSYKKDTLLGPAGMPVFRIAPCVQTSKKNNVLPDAIG
jgi:hypothetical protein